MHEGHRARIRAAYRVSGLDGLPDHNVLELLLTYAIPRRDVNETAHLLMTRFGSLDGVLAASVSDLMTVAGVGEQAAVFLHLIHDVNKRITLQSMSDKGGKVSLMTPQQACQYALTLAQVDRYETLRLICLDSYMRVLHADVLAVGNLSCVALEPRHVVEIALQQKARFLILTHNHPSGVILPSEDDKRAAELIADVCTKLGIDVRDQLILGKSAAYSYQYDKVFQFNSPTVCNTITLDAYRELLHAQARQLLS